MKRLLALALALTLTTMSLAHAKDSVKVFAGPKPTAKKITPNSRNQSQGNSARLANAKPQQVKSGTWTKPDGMPATRKPSPQIVQGRPMVSGTWTNPNGTPAKRGQVTANDRGTGIVETNGAPGGASVTYTPRDTSSRRPLTLEERQNRPVGGPANPGVKVLGKPAPSGTYSRGDLTGHGINPLKVFEDSLGYWGEKVGLGHGTITYPDLPQPQPPKKRTK
jgi:hypothetical protein